MTAEILPRICDRFSTTFFDGVIGHVAAGRFDAEQNVIAHVLLEKPIAVVTADNRIGQI